VTMGQAEKLQEVVISKLELRRKVRELQESYNIQEEHCKQLMDNHQESGPAQWRAFARLADIKELLDDLNQQLIKGYNK
jgi:hypothetical protein